MCLFIYNSKHSQADYLSLPLKRRLHATVLSMSVCRMKCLRYTKTQFSQKLHNLQLWSLAMTYRKFYMGFSKNPFLDP